MSSGPTGPPWDLHCLAAGADVPGAWARPLLWSPGLGVWTGDLDSNSVWGTHWGGGMPSDEGDGLTGVAWPRGHVGQVPLRFAGMGPSRCLVWEMEFLCTVKILGLHYFPRFPRFPILLAPLWSHGRRRLRHLRHPTVSPCGTPRRPYMTSPSGLRESSCRTPAVDRVSAVVLCCASDRVAGWGYACNALCPFPAQCPYSMTWRLTKPRDWQHGTRLSTTRPLPTVGWRRGPTI